ncbi:amidohydrolase family protein [Trinickia sp. LjRoot230]|uniref:amidohydrolase family protein n=1 Tax=Trinickia sp. LjRoot230 TaxID=3342288 RepID=UPI003ED0AA3E
MYLDGHFHIWSLARADYGWLTPEFGAIYRDFGIDDWRETFAPRGVSAGILVQAAATEAETRFLLDEASKQPELVAGVVGWADFERVDAAEHIAALAANSLLVGLRPMLQDLPDPAWIAQPFAGRALAAMTSAQLTFDALIRPVHLPYILDIARRNPSLTIVIDHAAKPAATSGLEYEAWAEGLAMLAALPSVYCKLSGLWTELAAGAPVSSVEPWVARVLECFGIERTIWGSDWPVVRCAGDGRAWFDYAWQCVAMQGPDAVAKVFGMNARRAYRLVL